MTTKLESLATAGGGNPQPRREFRHTQVVIPHPAFSSVWPKVSTDRPIALFFAGHTGEEPGCTDGRYAAPVVIP